MCTHTCAVASSVQRALWVVSRPRTDRRASGRLHPASRAPTASLRDGLRPPLTRTSDDLLCSAIGTAPPSVPAPSNAHPPRTPDRARVPSSASDAHGMPPKIGPRSRPQALVMNRSSVRFRQAAQSRRPGTSRFRAFVVLGDGEAPRAARLIPPRRPRAAGRAPCARGPRRAAPGRSCAGCTCRGRGPRRRAAA